MSIIEFSKDHKASINEQLEQAQQRVIASGCFDLLHVGHLNYLEASKELGDQLIVLVSIDADVRQFKGLGRPIIPQQQRARMVHALQVVDHVIIHDQQSFLPLLKELSPTLFTKGIDTDPAILSKELMDIIGEVHLVGHDSIKTQGTSDIIATCLRLREAQ